MHKPQRRKHLISFKTSLFLFLRRFTGWQVLKVKLLSGGYVSIEHFCAHLTCTSTSLLQRCAIRIKRNFLPRWALKRLFRSLLQWLSSLEQKQCQKSRLFPEVENRARSICESKDAAAASPFAPFLLTFRIKACPLRLISFTLPSRPANCRTLKCMLNQLAWTIIIIVIWRRRFPQHGEWGWEPAGPELDPEVRRIPSCSSNCSCGGEGGTSSRQITMLPLLGEWTHVSVICISFEMLYHLIGVRAPPVKNGQKHWLRDLRPREIRQHNFVRLIIYYTNERRDVFWTRSSLARSAQSLET